MSNILDPALASNIDNINYVVAQFPGGGQRGYATALLLEFFEKITGLPTHQLFPYVTAGSVGILIAAALYSPHPEHKAARMSAAQLVSVFPKIASRIPKGPAYLVNKNDHTVLGEAINILVGHAKLKDMLGSVFCSSHEIGALSSSSIMFSKIIDPSNGSVRYEGDSELDMVEIAYRGTALPAVYPARDDRYADIAFADVFAAEMSDVKNLFPSQTGAFVRVGNFRAKESTEKNPMIRSGYIQQAAKGSIYDAIADHAYSQTIRTARSLFGRSIFDLEQIIPLNTTDPPATIATVTTPEQFEKIRVMTEAYIENNRDVLTALAMRLKTLALERIEKYPATAFGIEPRIQEFPLPEIPAMPQKESTLRMAWDLAVYGKDLALSAHHKFMQAVKITTEYALPKTSQLIRTVYTHPKVQDPLKIVWDNMIDWRERAYTILLPNASPRREGQNDNPSAKP